jgi:tetratricopeptide (TPR) repeat protein
LEAEAHYSLGLALAQLQRLQEAIRELTDAVSLDPHNVDARVQLGLALSQNNDPAANLTLPIREGLPTISQVTRRCSVCE